jgi:hypothetical protein
VEGVRVAVLGVAVEAPGDEAAPPADRLHRGLGGPQPGLLDHARAEQLVDGHFGVLVVFGLDDVGARQAGLRPGPAVVWLVADQGELVALAGQGEAHPLLDAGVEVARRRRLHDFGQFLVAEPGDRVGFGRLRPLALGQEDDRARAVTADLGEQREAVVGVDAQLGGEQAPALALRQQALYVGACALVAVGLGAGRQRAAQHRRPGAHRLERLRVVGEAVAAAGKGTQRPDPHPV